MWITLNQKFLFLNRVGAGVAVMQGGDACVALVGIYTFHRHPRPLAAPNGDACVALVDLGRAPWGLTLALWSSYTSQSQSQPEIPYPVGTGADGMTGGGACAVLVDLVEF
jgi:hypothetical protein